ncbi:MAG: hypothetical protein BroJett005_30460 [Ignavibacteriota bacterium]|nr:MAG: hypothetical protein BroJett005_30460 [Ignavibacteriota bacterium]
MIVTLIHKAVSAINRSTAKRLIDELRAEGQIHSREAANCGRETMIHAIPPQSVAPLGLKNACFSGVCGPFDCVEESAQTPTSDPNPTRSGPRTPNNREAS